MCCNSSQYIKDFYNHTAARRNGKILTNDSITVLYSITVSIFAIGGLIGSLTVGMLVTKFGRYCIEPQWSIDSSYMLSEIMDDFQKKYLTYN